MEVRRSLKDYETSQESWEVLSYQAQDESRDVYGELEEYIDWRPVIPGGSFANCAFDFEAFALNRKAPSLIANVQRVTIFYMSGHNWVLSSLRDIQTALNVGYPESVAPPPGDESRGSSKSSP